MQKGLWKNWKHFSGFEPSVSYFVVLAGNQLEVYESGQFLIIDLCSGMGQQAWTAPDPTPKVPEIAQWGALTQLYLGSTTTASWPYNLNTHFYGGNSWLSHMSVWRYRRGKHPLTVDKSTTEHSHMWLQEHPGSGRPTHSGMECSANPLRGPPHWCKSIASSTLQ